MKNDDLMSFSFQNLREKDMTFEQVFTHISSFMKQEPHGNYRLMIGTDSQVHPRYTRFITGVVIQREGKGAWACIRKIIVPRKMLNLRERISFETSLSEQMVSLFDEEKRTELIDIVLPHIYKGSSFTFEGHIDIGAGRRNKTREFVEEMVSRMEALGIEPKIKPNAFVASNYANRFTK